MSHSSKLLVVYAVIVLVLAVLLFGGIVKVKADSPIVHTSGIYRESGSECHGYNGSKAVIQPVYDYCQVESGSTPIQPVQKVKKGHKKNNDTVSIQPVVNYGDDGIQLPNNDGNQDQDDNKGNDKNKDKKNNGNHYGNDKGDSNCKDDKNKHDTCNTTPLESTAFGLFVTLLLVKTGEKIRMDGVRSVDILGNKVTITKRIDDGNEIAFYDIPHAKIDNVFLSESPFHHTDDSDWSQYLRD